MKWEKNYTWAAVGYMVACVIPIIITGFSQHSLEVGWTAFLNAFPFITVLAVIFFGNMLWLSPKFLRDDRKMFYIVANILLIIGGNIVLHLLTYWDPSWGIGYLLLAFFGRSLFLFMMVTIAHLICATNQRTALKKQLETEQARRHEAELAMLKTQLNPHFLFNTLNNISSMVQIDPDQAQDSIAQLSDLLRYTLYDSTAAQVPLEQEIEFMNNYIDLMKLRYNDSADIEVSMNPSPAREGGREASIQIAPLLFISLIENAFKHGVRSSKPSFVRISLGVEDGCLIFSCENSLFPKEPTDHVGSGIGLENMRKRLELAYSGRYDYEVETNDGTYKASVRIRL